MSRDRLYILLVFRGDTRRGSWGGPPCMNTRDSHSPSYSSDSLGLCLVRSSSELCGFFSPAPRSIFRVPRCSPLVTFPYPGLRFHLVVNHRVPIPSTRHLLNCPSCSTFVVDHIFSVPQSPPDSRLATDSFRSTNSTTSLLIDNLNLNHLNRAILQRTPRHPTSQT